VSLLKISHCFKCIAGKCGVRTAKADCYQQSPSWIHQYALRCPNQKEAQNQAAGDVDEECSKRERRVTKARDDPAYEIAQIYAENTAQRDPKIGFPIEKRWHMLPQSLKDLVGVISRLGRRLKAELHRLDPIKPQIPFREQIKLAKAYLQI